MSLPFLTVDDLVTSVTRSSSLPLSQSTFQSTDIVAFLDEEEKMTISNIIHNVREEFWVTNYDTPILQNVFTYAIPQRCLAGGLRDVVFVDASGNEIEVAHLAPEQIKNPATISYRPAFGLQGFFVQNDKVVLWPQNQNNTAYTLRMKAERRPNALTLSTNCAQIVSVNSGAGTVTVASVPSTIAVNGVIDIISNLPQFSSQGDGITITNVNNTVLTLSPFPTTAPLVGAWVCPTGTTCVPQIPVEAYPLLVTLGVKRVHMAMQNANGFQIALKQEQSQTGMLGNMLTPRVEGSPQKLVNRNWFGGYNGPSSFYR